MRVVGIEDVKNFARVVPHRHQGMTLAYERSIFRRHPLDDERFELRVERRSDFRIDARSEPRDDRGFVGGPRHRMAEFVHIQAQASHDVGAEAGVVVEVRTEVAPLQLGAQFVDRAPGGWSASQAASCCQVSPCGAAHIDRQPSEWYS